MKKNGLTIFEHEKKELDKSWTAKDILLLDKLNIKLRKLYKTESDIIQVQKLPKKLPTIKATSYVGVIRVGRKSIQVIPKIARNDDDTDSYTKMAISNLLYMLSFTRKLSIKEADLASLRRVDDDFYEVLIFLFAKNLLSLIQNDINKQYVSQEENLPYLKGKLQFAEHIKKNSINRTNFYLQYDEFCEDNPLNQILKYTVHLLSNNTKSFRNLKMLRELSFLFSDITLRRISEEDFKKIHLNRLNGIYEPVLNLAKVFICQSSLEMSADNISTFSFMFDMNALFEEYVGEMMRRSCRDAYPSITLQKPCWNLVESKIVDGQDAGPLFNMRPDISLGHKYDQPEVIIDTKYKLLEKKDRKEGVSQADMYQMHAYSKKYNCPNIILLYPQKNGEQDQQIDFKVDDNTLVKVRGIDICRDLKKDRVQVEQDLRKVVGA